MDTVAAKLSNRVRSLLTIECAGADTSRAGSVPDLHHSRPTRHRAASTRTWTSSCLRDPRTPCGKLHTCVLVTASLTARALPPLSACASRTAATARAAPATGIPRARATAAKLSAAAISGRSSIAAFHIRIAALILLEIPRAIRKRKCGANAQQAVQ